MASAKPRKHGCWQVASSISTAFHSHLMETNPESVEVYFKTNAEEMIKRVQSFSPFKGSKPKADVLKQVEDYQTDFLKLAMLCLQRQTWEVCWLEEACLWIQRDHLLAIDLLLAWD